MSPSPSASYQDLHGRAKKCTWWSILWKILVIVLIIGVLSLVAYDLRRKKLQDGIIEGIYCFECTYVTGMNLTELGLAFEKECRTNPRNFRKCASGQMCVYGQVELGKAKRFYRMCSDSKRTGCTTYLKPTKGNACYCNKPKCNGKTA